MDDAPWRDFALLLSDVQHDFWTAKRRTAHPHFPENIARLLTLDTYAYLFKEQRTLKIPNSLHHVSKQLILRL
jgi:hypothetical protein